MVRESNLRGSAIVKWNPSCHLGPGFDKGHLPCFFGSRNAFAIYSALARDLLQRPWAGRQVSGGTAAVAASQRRSNARPAQGYGSSRLMPVHERYDISMTRSKIAISLPKDQLVRVHREIRAGRADSVSGYIAQVLAEHEKRESLRTLLRDLIEQYGEPAAEDKKWAESALAPRRG